MKERVKKKESQKLLLLHTFALDQGRGGSNANKQSNFLAPLRKHKHVEFLFGSMVSWHLGGTLVPLAMAPWYHGWHLGTMVT